MPRQRKPALIVTQIVLALVIAGLAYLLYQSITEPYRVIERQQELTERTRVRMGDARIALRRFEEIHDTFPPSLDSLARFVETDSLLTTNPDSIFGETFEPDSFLYSTRGGRRLEYVLNDTSRVKIYLLKDPATDSKIGSDQPDITQLHAASWE